MSQHLAIATERLKRELRQLRVEGRDYKSHLLLHVVKGVDRRFAVTGVQHNSPLQYGHRRNGEGLCAEHGGLEADGIRLVRNPPTRTAVTRPSVSERPAAKSMEADR